MNEPQTPSSWRVCEKPALLPGAQSRAGPGGDLGGWVRGHTPLECDQELGPPCGGWGPTVEGGLEVLLVFQNLLEEHHGKLVVVGGCHSHAIALQFRVSCGEDSERSALAGRTEQLLSPQPSTGQHLCGSADGSVSPLGGSRPWEPQSQGPDHSGLTLNVAQAELARLETWNKSSGKVVTVLVPVGARDMWVSGETQRLGPPGLDEVGAAAGGAGILAPQVQPSPSPTTVGG